jgi:uncharacterized protein
VRTRLRRDLIVALKARDDVAVVALRSAIAAIDNAEAVEVRGASRREGSSEHIAGASAGVGSAEAERRVLSDAGVQAVIRAQADERSQAAHEYEELGRDDVAVRLRLEAALLRAYLPRPDRDGENGNASTA